MNACIALVLFVTALRLYLNLRQSRFLATSGEATAYAIAIVRLRSAGAILQVLAAGAMLEWFTIADACGTKFCGGPVLVILVLLQCQIDLLLAAVKSFVVDRQFGFNRLSVRRFLIEAALALLIRAVVASLLALLALYLLNTLGKWWWLPFTALFALGAKGGGDLYKGAVVPYLQQQSLLEPGQLAAQLRECLDRCGFADAQLVVARGSMRSTQANAHAEQVGWRKQVVLLDTLLERLSPVQVEAVVAHELGHLAKHHLQQRFLLLCAIWTAVAAVAAFIAQIVVPVQDWRQIAAVLVLAQPLRFLLQPLLMRSLRIWEFEADSFSTRHVSPRALSGALSALVAMNAAAAGSDPWFAKFHDSHPPLAQRLRRLSES